MMFSIKESKVDTNIKPSLLSNNGWAVPEKIQTSRGGVEDMEFSGVSNKKHAKFPGVTNPILTENTEKTSI